MGSISSSTTHLWFYFSSSITLSLSLFLGLWTVCSLCLKGIQPWYKCHLQVTTLNSFLGILSVKLCFSFFTAFIQVVLKSPLDLKEIKVVNLKGNQPWIFIERTETEAEASTLWPPDTKSQLIGKDPDAGKDWRQLENGTTEDEMVGWHHWTNGHEFE